MNKCGYVYMVTNTRNTVLYTGVTSDLVRRVGLHREKVLEGFTKKYNAVKLVYYEKYDAMMMAIEREKQIKAGSREKKIKLINSINPKWNDLYHDIIN